MVACRYGQCSHGQCLVCEEKRLVSKQANLISTKLQDNLWHITFTHDIPICYMPHLKYCLSVSIRNYIITTIWLVNDIFTSMPHLDSYVTKYHKFL